MALAVCLLFDRPGDRLVRGLWRRLEAEGVPSLLSHTHGRHHPHLSYAVLLTWDLDLVEDALAHLPDGGGFPLFVQGALLFPRGRVALAPAVTADLAARQEQVAFALAATGAELHHHYEPGRWVPHVSVATGATGQRLPLAATGVSDALPITLMVARAALVDSSTGQAWPLPLIP